MNTNMQISLIKGRALAKSCRTTRRNEKVAHIESSAQACINFSITRHAAESFFRRNWEERQGGKVDVHVVHAGSARLAEAEPEHARLACGLAKGARQKAARRAARESRR